MSRDEDREAILTVAAFVPLIVFRVGISFLRLKRRANKASKCFFNELVRNGVPPQEARKLAEEYTSVVSIRYWAKNLAGLSGLGDLARSGKP